jgi:hypothetical protein
MEAGVCLSDSAGPAQSAPTGSGVLVLRPNRIAKNWA